MYELNEKIRDLVPYEPIDGDYPIRLDANESFLPLPEELRTRIAQTAAQAAFNRYPDPLSRDVTQAFAAYYGISPDLVTAGNGSDELISILCTSFLMKGDAMMVILPDFSMYQFYASLAEGRVVACGKRGDLTIDVDEVIAKAQAENVKMIVFSNPCNPTSLGLPREEVRRLIRSVDALVVLDEAYMDFWDQSLLGEVEDYDNLIILRTCSKAIGAAALRLGFAVAAPRLTRVLRAVKSPYNVNSLSQAIGTLVLGEREWEAGARAQIVDSRRALQLSLARLQEEFPGVFTLYDSCTNFVFLKTGRAKELFDGLLARGIAVRLFNGYLRVTAGSKEENAAFLEAFTALLRGEEKA